MGRLLPSLQRASANEDAVPRVVGLDSEDAEELIAAMSSETARELLAALHEEPAAPSELAARVDTSLQNAQYHLGKLEDAGVVEVADVVYSEKGREMKVYAPADDPLVVVAGDDETTTSLRAALTGLLGAVGVLAFVSFVVQRLFAEEEEPQAVQVRAMSADATAASGPGLLDPLTEPGVLFFAGGLAVLLVGFLVWYARR